MPGYYIFLLQFHSNDEMPNKCVVTLEQHSMDDFSKLKENLAEYHGHEPFKIQYFDDEEDLVPIDTEEEFKEFAKFARQHCSLGITTKLVLTPDQKNYSRRSSQAEAGKMTSPNSDEVIEHLKKIDEIIKCGMANDDCSVMDQVQTEMYTSKLAELKGKLKSEIKEEILSEMREQMGIMNHKASGVDITKENTGYDEDSDGNMLCQPEKRKVKSVFNQKKLEKKEKLAEAKIDQRLEKLELKKKKLLEKASLRTGNKKAAVDPTFGMPCIMSAIVPNHSSTLLKRVTVGKVFVHLWHVINDGTVTWNDVELRHNWSSPGLEPDELSVKCLPLIPGQEGQIAVKFKAPKIVGGFVSYWNFFYLVDSYWQQFGHYVCVAGNTKLPKLASSTGVIKAQEKTLGTVDTKTMREDCDKFLKYHLESQKMLVEANKTHLKACLASSEIAAEMAREAANAAVRSGMGKQVVNLSKPDEMDKLNHSSRMFLPEIGTVTCNEGGKSVLIGAAKETNDLKKESLMETNENLLENNKMDLGAIKEQLKISLASAEIAADMARQAANAVLKSALIKPVTASANPGNINKLTQTIEELNYIDSGSDNDANLDASDDTDQFVIVDIHTDKDVQVNVHPSSVGEKENNKENKTSAMLEEKKVTNNSDVMENTIPPVKENDEADVLKEHELSIHTNGVLVTEDISFEKQNEPQQAPPLIQKLDPNLNFPVFNPQRVPIPVYPPQHILSHQHAPPAFPVFQASSSSSHPLVFPPSPMINFTTPKINPPVHYSQVPTYPPMPGSSHPMTLISSGLPPQSSVAPPSQMGPLHLNSSPITPQQMMGPFPINSMIPFHPYAYNKMTGQTTSAASISSDSKTTASVCARNTHPLLNYHVQDNCSVSTPNRVPNNVWINKATMTSTTPPTNNYTTSSSVNSAPVATAHTTKPETADKNKKSESGGQILPQALVDGAINVAASAYSTAWNALHNLRSKDGQAVEFDPVFENHMAVLAEMGFNNYERNGRLLKRFNNDIVQVIAVICAGGSNNLEID